MKKDKKKLDLPKPEDQVLDEIMDVMGGGIGGPDLCITIATKKKKKPETEES